MAATSAPRTFARSRPFTSLADVLEPDGADEAPTRAGDIAFADTVVAAVLPDDVIPASAPIFVTEAPARPSFAPSPRVLRHLVRAPRRLRLGLRVALAEAKQVWASTGRDGASPLSRVRALPSAWDWSPADVLRGAALGGIVFVIAAVLGIGALVRPAAPPTRPELGGELAEARAPNARGDDHVALGGRSRGRTPPRPSRR